jgi:hypothetical protein
LHISTPQSQQTVSTHSVHPAALHDQQCRTDRFSVRLWPHWRHFTGRLSEWREDADEDNEAEGSIM